MVTKGEFCLTLLSDIITAVFITVGCFAGIDVLTDGNILPLAVPLASLWSTDNAQDAM
jgi:hypothetical protein